MSLDLFYIFSQVRDTNQRTWHQQCGDDVGLYLTIATFNYMTIMKIEYLQTNSWKNSCLTAELEQDRCYADKQRKILSTISASYAFSCARRCSLITDQLSTGDANVSSQQILPSSTPQQTPFDLC